MKVKRIRLIHELLAEQMNHWMLFPIALTMMEMTRGQTGMEKPDILLWILCSVFPLIFFVLRLSYSRHRKMFLFLLSHTAAAAAGAFILLIPSRPFMSRAICILCALGYLLHSLLLQLKKNTLYTAAMQLPAGVALSVLSSLMKHTNQWNHYYLFSLMGVIAAFFLLFYLRQYMYFLSLNKGSTGHIPADDIFRSGTGLVVGYTLFGTVLLLIGTRYEWLAEIVQSVLDYLFRLLRFLLSKLPGRKAGEEMSVPEDSGISMPDPQLPQPAETFWLWKVLEVIFAAVLVLGLLYVTVRLLLKLLQLLQNYLNRRMAGYESGSEEAADLREKCISEKGSEKKKADLSRAFTNREKVRRLYKRKLLLSAGKAEKYSHAERKRLGLFTAREWEQKLHTDGMADIYEKTRYSEEEITAEDVRKMRDACK